MKNNTTTWSFSITPNDESNAAAVSMESTIPADDRNVEDEFASVLLCVGHIVDPHDPLRGLIFLIGNNLSDYAAVDFIAGQKPVKSGSGLSPLRYLLTTWAQFPNEQGQPGNPTAIEINATNAPTVDTIAPLLASLKQQILNLETEEEREQIRQQLDNLFGNQ